MPSGEQQFEQTSAGTVAARANEWPGEKLVVFRSFYHNEVEGRRKMIGRFHICYKNASAHKQRGQRIKTLCGHNIFIDLETGFKNITHSEIDKIFLKHFKKMKNPEDRDYHCNYEDDFDCHTCYCVSCLKSVLV